jgi:VanZ family protein
MKLGFIEQHWHQLTFIILAVITLFSLWPVAQLPEVPGTDKTHHLIAYLVASFPICIKRPQYWRALLLAIVMYSGLIELLQPYVNRYGEWLDLMANAIGALLAVLLSDVLLKLKLHR